MHVSKAKGVIGRPKPKSRRSVEYADMNGAYVDTSKVVYEKREIELECFITKVGRSEMLAAYHEFIDMLNAEGTRRLSVSLDGTEDNALLFEVYNDGSMVAEPSWNDSQDVWTFTINLVEARPLKMAYVVYPESVAGNVEVTLDCTGSVDIHWGDNTHKLDAEGTIEHTYEGEDIGKVYLVISGEIDTIESVEINADNELIWERL